MDTQTLVFTVAASAASIITGWIFKNKTPIPNGFIPLINGVLAVGGLVLLTDTPFKAAVISALAVVGAGVTAYEAPRGVKELAQPSGGVQ